MFNKFKFTVIMTCCNNEAYIEKSILSIINQKISFKRNVELIILNNIEDTDVNNIIGYYKSIYPENIILISDYDKSYIQLYNECLNSVNGKYLTFLDSNDYLSNNTLSSVYNTFEKKDVDIVKISEIYLSRKMKKNNKIYKRNELVNVLARPNKIITSIKSLFFRTNSITKFFDESLNISSQLDFINQILLNKKQYFIINAPRYYHSQKYPQAPKEINDVGYYTPRLINFHKKLISDYKNTFRYIPTYIQKVLLDDVVKLIENNNIGILDENALNEFWDSLIEIVKALSQNVIRSSNYDEQIKSFIMFIRNNKERSLELHDDTLYMYSGSNLIENTEENKLYLNNVYIDDDYLNIEASFKTHLDDDNIQINVISNTCNKKLKLKSKVDFPINKVPIKYLGVSWIYEYTFNVQIPVDKTRYSKNSIELIYGNDINSVKYTPKLNPKLTSNLYGVYSYKSKVDEYLIYLEDNQIISSYYRKVNKINPLFSVIMPVYNCENYLKEAIDSVINQTLNFERYVQLVIIDDGSTDNSLEIINQYKKEYPNNIVVISKKHEGVSHSRNLGMAHAIGKYISFLDSDDYLSKNALKHVNALFKKHHKKVDVISLLIKYFEMENSSHELRYKFKGNKILDINKHPNYPQISVSSTFIKRSVIRDISFNNDLICGEDILFVNQVLLKRKKILTTDVATYYCRKRSSGDSIHDLSIDKKEYYTDRLKNLHLNLINQCLQKYNKIPNFIQYTLAYDLSKYLNIYKLDVFDDEDETEEFYNTFKEVLTYINNNALKRNRNIRGNNRNFLLYMRNPEEYHIELIDGNINLKQDNIRLESFNTKKIGVDFVEIKDGFLNIGGYFNTFFNQDIISINLIQESLNDNNKKTYESNLFTYPQEDRRTIQYLSIPWKYFHHFEFKLPLNELVNTKLTFLIKYDDGTYCEEYNPELGLRLPSGLSTTGIYMVKQSVIVFFQGKSLKIIPESYKSMLRLEFSVARKLFRDKREGYISVFFMRLLYLALYPFMKNKKIWLFNDRPLIADDNAKHLFKYSVSQNDGINKYYILRRESDDFDEMKKISKNIVPFASLKHKILFFFAQKHISAFVNEDYRNPFYEPGGFDHRRLLSGLSTTQRYFLQHGVIFANVTRSLKKYNNNLSLLLCSSDLERQSFFDWHYNFSEDVVTTLGLPRHDNLTTDDTKKQIVFMPTWRGNLKTENALFNSEFFKSLNSFINNEELHEFLKENGYEFVFKPHPVLLKHLDKMKLNENLKMALDESYQDIFRDSSILITDYSSVAFDFAYLKKPLIYYQPNDDYPYEEGYMDFETMAFGDVIYTEEDMVERIKKYIKSGCVMEDKYKERVNNFFKYTDNQNCKRTYEWILNH